MGFLYSTPFSPKKELQMEELIKQYPKNILVLDTNVCVHLREFYNNPKSFIEKQPSIVGDLVNLLGNVERYDLEVAIGLGLDESSRSMENFQLHKDKRNQTKDSIFNLLNLDSTSLIQLVYSNNVIESIKNVTQKTNSKIDAFQHDDSIFSGINLPTYACMLKIYLLNHKLKQGKIDRLQAFKQVIQFMDEELDLVGAIVAAFAFHYFGDNSLTKKMLNKKAKGKNEVIHNIWNASLDVCIPLLVAKHYNKGVIPILVTADKGLNNLLEQINFESISTVDGKVAPVPQLTGFAGNGTKWTDDELKQIHYLTSEIQLKRSHKIANFEIDDELPGKILKIIENLETKI